PCGVVRRRRRLLGVIAMALHCLAEPAAELGPWDAGALERDDGEAERSSLPGLLEDELAVRARQRRRRGQRAIDVCEPGVGDAHAPSPERASGAGRAPWRVRRRCGWTRTVLTREQ